MINLIQMNAIHLTKYFLFNVIRDKINNSYVLSIICHVRSKLAQQFTSYKPTNDTRPDIILPRTHINKPIPSTNN